MPLIRVVPRPLGISAFDPPPPAAAVRALLAADGVELIENEPPPRRAPRSANGASNR